MSPLPNIKNIALNYIAKIFIVDGVRRDRGGGGLLHPDGAWCCVRCGVRAAGRGVDGGVVPGGVGGASHRARGVRHRGGGRAVGQRHAHHLHRGDRLRTHRPDDARPALRGTCRNTPVLRSRSLGGAANARFRRPFLLRFGVLRRPSTWIYDDAKP